MAVTLLGDAEKTADHFGAFPENRVYELEFPVPGWQFSSNQAISRHVLRARHEPLLEELSR